MKIDTGPAQRRFVREHARTATRPITGQVVRETQKAWLISTGIREAWVPKSLVTQDQVTGVFTMPHWLTVAKLLD